MIRKIIEKITDYTENVKTKFDNWFYKEEYGNAARGILKFYKKK